MGSCSKKATRAGEARKGDDVGRGDDWVCERVEEGFAGGLGYHSPYSYFVSCSINVISALSRPNASYTAALRSVSKLTISSVSLLISVLRSRNSASQSSRSLTEISSLKDFPNSSRNSLKDRFHHSVSRWLGFLLGVPRSLWIRCVVLRRTS